MIDSAASISLAGLLPQVVVLAREAGSAVMAIYNTGNVQTQYKGDASPLTEADLTSHRIIVDGLARLAPGWPALSEESAEIDFEQRRAWRYYWLVDPLDGTKEFIKRNGEFTVNIALIENGQPILGVVYAPVLGVSYYAARDVGAFIQRGELAQPIRAQAHIAGQSIKVVASRSHSDDRTLAMLKKLGEYQCISMGSSLKLCLVAEGAAHFYPRLGPTMEWDTAAAHAVVMMAGGVVHDHAGKELRYNKPDLHNPEFFVRARTDSQLSKAIKVLNP